MNLLQNTKGKIAILLFLLIIFFPVIAEGFVFDAAKASLAGLSELTGPVIALVFSSLIILFIGYIGILISTSLLDWAIQITPEALTVMSGEGGLAVQAGWNFVSGIVNMLLVIAFVAIAISIILGADTLGLKKALPQLIIVALLVNFTLLFVGMGIDISNFLFNSIASQLGVEDGVSTMIFEFINPLIDYTKMLWIGGLAFLSGLGIGLGIPYVNVGLQIAWLVAFPLLLPFIVQWAVLGALMIMLSILFLIFFVVFIMRIFIIQLLAIVSPLAFFCLIFPGTRKYLNLWVQHLVQWLFVGVVFIFLMYIGFALAPLMMNLAEPISDEFPSWLIWFGAGDFLPYIILLIYFVAIIGFSKKFVPAMASSVIKQGTSAVKTALPYVGAVSKGGGLSLRKSMGITAKKMGEGRVRDSDFDGTTAAGLVDKTRMEQWKEEAKPGSGAGRFRSKKAELFVRMAEGLSEQDKEKVREEEEKSKDKSSRDRGKAFDVGKKGGSDKDHIKMLGSILAALEKGEVKDLRKIPAVEAVLKNPNETAKLYKMAESVDELKRLRKALPGIAISEETKGLSETEKESKVAEILAKDFKGKKMEEAAPQLIYAKNNGTEEEKGGANMIINAMFNSNDPAYITNLIKGGPGTEAEKIIEKHIDTKAGIENFSEGEKIEKRWKYIEGNHPELAKRLTNTPSTGSLGISIPRNVKKDRGGGLPEREDSPEPSSNPQQSQQSSDSSNHRENLKKLLDEERTTKKGDIDPDPWESYRKLFK